MKIDKNKIIKSDPISVKPVRNKGDIRSEKIIVGVVCLIAIILFISKTMKLWIF